MLVVDGRCRLRRHQVHHCCHCPGIAALVRHLPHPLIPFRDLPPHMGKTEEVERGAARPARVPCALRPMKAKVDEARLVGMKGEPIPGKPLAQCGEDPSGIFEHLEGHDTVISVPHEDTVPLETRSAHPARTIDPAHHAGVKCLQARARRHRLAGCLRSRDAGDRTPALLPSADLEKLYRPSMQDPGEQLRQKPGPNPKGDWPNIIGAWLVCLAKNNPSALDNVGALTSMASTFLEKQIGWLPQDPKEIRLARPSSPRAATRCRPSYRSRSTSTSPTS